MKIIIFFVMNAFLIKENRDFPLIKDYHSNLQSSLSYFIFFPSFCYIWSSCNKEKNKPPFLMQKMSLKLRVKEGVRQEVLKLVEQGIAVPSSSPWASPVVPVPKPDGTIESVLTTES